MKNYKELNVWKKGIEIVKATYQLSKQFPKEEKYAMISQMTRAAASIPANIAEGSSRFSPADRKNFLVISRGSAFECVAVLDIIGCTKKQRFPKIENSFEEISKMLYKMISTLKSQLKT